MLPTTECSANNFPGSAQDILVNVLLQESPTAVDPRGCEEFRTTMKVHKKLIYRWQMPPDAVCVYKRQSVLFHSHGGATYTALTDACVRRTPNIAYNLTPSMRGSPLAIRFIFGMGKLEWLGYNLVKVAWWSTQSFGYNTSTWQTHRQTATSP